MMVSTPTRAPPVHKYFLVVFLDCNVLEIKDFFSKFTPEWKCLVHSRIYGGLKNHLTYTQNNIRTMVILYKVLGYVWQVEWVGDGRAKQGRVLGCVLASTAHTH